MTQTPSLNVDILDLARRNDFFRKEVHTGEHSQLVLMSLKPGEEIGEEVHDVDQILYFVTGEGSAVLNGEESKVKTGSLVVVPAGTRHNFTNVGREVLKLFTVYAPPEEKPGTIHRTKAEAMAAEEGH